MIETITRQHRGFSCLLYRDIDASFKADRPSYHYNVQTPPFVACGIGDDTPVFLDGVNFIGNEFCPKPSALKSKERILDELLQWICLRPGDTDKEYFDSYTPEQLLWANSLECELVSSELPED